ncbi:MAG: hypothetical protein ACXVLQ_13650 [Bacteriovorax sp.]
MKSSLLITFIISLNFAHGAEADNFTARSLNLLDASAQVNSLANAYLKTAVEETNRASNCNEDALYLELRKYFANHSKGQLVQEILYSKKIANYALPIKDSIYSEWTVSNGYLLGRKKAATSPLALSPLIQIGDQIVGVDKFEHMFGMGFSYFIQFYKNKAEISKVLKKGIFKEKTILGGNVFATGVFSYGDLSANFNGMRFWNHMLQKHGDILGVEHDLGPYVTCENSKWKVVEKNPIDFRNYIDASMDESINCSKFANKSGERKFRRALLKRNFEGPDGSSLCPVDPDKLQDVKNKYSPSNIQHFIINDDGTGTVSYFNEF